MVEGVGFSSVFIRKAWSRPWFTWESIPRSCLAQAAGGHVGEESSSARCIRPIALAALMMYSSPAQTKRRTKQGSGLMVYIFIAVPSSENPRPTEALAPALRETPSNKELQLVTRRLFWAAAERPAMVSGSLLRFASRGFCVCVPLWFVCRIIHTPTSRPLNFA